MCQGGVAGGESRATDARNMSDFTMNLVPGLAGAAFGAVATYPFHGSIALSIGGLVIAVSGVVMVWATQRSKKSGSQSSVESDPGG